jgi:hypothetical protein
MPRRGRLGGVSAGGVALRITAINPASVSNRMASIEKKLDVQNESPTPRLDSQGRVAGGIFTLRLPRIRGMGNIGTKSHVSGKRFELSGGSAFATDGWRFTIRHHSHQMKDPFI